MPKNCRAAIYEGTANLSKKRKDVQRILKDTDSYVNYISTILGQGWFAGSVRCKTIKEGPRRKERKLLIPSTLDHLFHVTIMRPLIPILMKRFDYYSCGSIKKRGPKRVHKALKGWIRKEHYEYAAVCDVRKFYESVRPEVVMACLRKFIKDEKYLHLHEIILNQMTHPVVQHYISEEDYASIKGLAIGFSTSHWYGNLVLTETDRLLRREFPAIKFVRYMDDYALLSHDKALLHSAIDALKLKLAAMGLSLKNNWQVFPIASRPLEFLSYRYFANGKVLMRKPLMYSLSRKAKLTAKHFTSKNSKSFISKLGVAKHANSRTYKLNYIYPVISVKACKKLISFVDKKSL